MGPALWGRKCIVFKEAESSLLKRKVLFKTVISAPRVSPNKTSGLLDEFDTALKNVGPDDATTTTQKPCKNLQTNALN